MFTWRCKVLQLQNPTSKPLKTQSPKHQIHPPEVGSGVCLPRRVVVANPLHRPLLEHGEYGTEVMHQRPRDELVEARLRLGDPLAGAVGQRGDGQAQAALTVTLQVAVAGSSTGESCRPGLCSRSPCGSSSGSRNVETINITCCSHAVQGSYFIDTHGSYFIDTHGPYFLIPHGSYFIVAHGPYFLVTHGPYFIVTHGPYFLVT